MNLGEFLARKAVTAVRSHMHEAQIRAEHDAWVKENGPGTYYTALPTGAHGPQYSDTMNEPVHSEYEFTKRGSGFLSGQLVTDWGTNSWSVWLKHGPLTANPMPTHRSLELRDERGGAAEMRRAQQAVTSAVLAELRARYPHSAALVG